MKDLLLYTADADAAAFLGALLTRHEALGVRQLQWDVDRNPGRDSGMVQNGPELLRLMKGRHQKAMLVLDHQGSGRERHGAESLAADLQDRLDRCSWSGNSAVVVVEPELERWLWFSGSALARHCGLSQTELNAVQADWAQTRGLTLDEARRTFPKELFEHLVRDRLRRTISPRDFENLGRLASVKALLSDPSFVRIAGQLRAWFPLNVA